MLGRPQRQMHPQVIVNQQQGRNPGQHHSDKIWQPPPSRPQGVYILLSPAAQRPGREILNPPTPHLSICPPITFSNSKMHRNNYSKLCRYVHQVMGVCCIVFDINWMLFLNFFRNFWKMHLHLLYVPLSSISPCNSNTHCCIFSKLCYGCVCCMVFDIDWMLFERGGEPGGVWGGGCQKKFRAILSTIYGSNWY